MTVRDLIVELVYLERKGMGNITVYTFTDSARIDEIVVNKYGVFLKNGIDKDCDEGTDD